MSIIDFYVMGGIPYMTPLTLALLAIVGVIILSFVRKENREPKWLEAIKQLGGFALAAGAFGTLVGLYEAFSDLSTMEQMLPLNVIMGGLKVALITTLYGFGIFLFSQVYLIVLKSTKKG
jgi:flagellar motor component MotA